MLRFLPVLLMLAACRPASPPPEAGATLDFGTLADSLYGALQQSETRTAVALTEAVFTQQGASLDDRLFVRVNDYREVFNYYSDDWVLIALSRMPEPREAETYWYNWSRVLTNGAWDPAAFFIDEAEWLLMANYNILNIYAHEIGHHLAFRYRVNPDHSLNCEEYFADQFAIGFVNWMAEDPRFAHLRSRYAALIADFNAAIPRRDRFEMADYATLDADCAAYEVPDPQRPEELAPYASAFFERQRLLLGTDAHPPLATLIATLLPAWQADFFGRYPYLDTTVAVRTIAAVEGHYDLQDELAYQAGYVPLLLEQENANRLIRLDGEGRPHGFYWPGINPARGRTAYRWHIHPPGADSLTITLTPPEETALGLFPLDIQPTEEGYFALIAAFFPEGERRNYTLDLIRTRSGWEQSWALLNARNEFLVLMRGSGSWHVYANKAVYPLDPATKQIGAPVWQQPGVAPPRRPEFFAYDSQGGLYLVSDDQTVMRWDSTGIGTVVGNALGGRKDSTDPAKVEFSQIVAMTLAEEGLLYIADQVHRDTVWVREVRF